jgi:hypothetical protein
MLHVPVRIGRIVQALEREATTGNTQAARELRNWLAEYPPESTEFDPSSLDRELRKRIYARLLAEDAADRGA